MQITKKDYATLTKKRSPNTKLYKTLPKAFIFGGIVCCIGQGFLNLYTRYGFDKLDAGALTSITLMLIAAILTGFRVYDKIAKHAGAGTLVPITGFANSVVAPALEFKTEGYILGVGAKIFTIAGPVILYGVTASALYGIVYYVFKF